MANIEKRYQVFVSSTYRDLIPERKEIMQALLELDCIPSGMELFQATDDDQWSLIKGVIDDCDYYMVIVAGRYGSIGPTGLSYTEMEYRYAIQKQKPVIGFLHLDPGKLAADKCETDAAARTKLSEFRTLCETKMVQYWDGPQDLGGKVSRSIIKLIRDRPAVGWIRGDAVASDQANSEILRLRQKIDELEASLSQNSAGPPDGVDDLLQDGDDISLEASVRYYENNNMVTTKVRRVRIDVPWVRVFNKTSPRLLDEISEADLSNAVNELFSEYVALLVAKNSDFASKRIRAVSATTDSFQKIKIQLVALGLIKRGDKKRTASDAQPYWKLTAYGESKMMTALAERKAIRLDPA